MNENAKKLVIIATHAEENPDKATIPFAIASTALAMDVKAVIILQTTAVFLATKGYAQHVHSVGCLQSRKIEPTELISQAQIIAGATVVAESLAADRVLSY